MDTTGPASRSAVAHQRTHMPVELFQLPGEALRVRHGERTCRWRGFRGGANSSLCRAEGDGLLTVLVGGAATIERMSMAKDARADARDRGSGVHPAHASTGRVQAAPLPASASGANVVVAPLPFAEGKASRRRRTRAGRVAGLPSVLAARNSVLRPCTSSRVLLTPAGRAPIRCRSRQRKTSSSQDVSRGIGGSA